MKFIKIVIQLVVGGIVPVLAFFISLTIPRCIAFYSTFIDTRASFIAFRAASVLYIVFALGVFAFRQRIYRLWEDLLDDYETITAVPESKPIDDGLPLLTGVLISGMIVFAAYTLYLCFTDSKAYMDYVAEDGLVEMAEAIFWALASITFFISMFVGGISSRPKTIAYILLALFCFICMGEEVSWGQRIFHYNIRTIEAINKQREVNLHNIGSISLYEYPVVIGSFVLLFLGPFFLSRYKKWGRYLRHYGLPNLHRVVSAVFGIGLLTWLTVGIRFGTLGFSPYSKWGYYTQADDEIYEFIMPYGFFCFGLLDLAMRIRRRKADAEKAPLQPIETG